MPIARFLVYIEVEAYFKTSAVSHTFITVILIVWLSVTPVELSKLA
jgi:hypothetical protein